MATALGVAHSTVKAWHYARAIPVWRHQHILERAAALKIALTSDELVRVRRDSRPLPRGARPGQKAAA